MTAGNTITVDMQMALGQASDVITVEGQAAQMNYESQRSRAPSRATRFRNCPPTAAAFCSGATLSQASRSLRSAGAIQLAD